MTASEKADSTSQPDAAAEATEAIGADLTELLSLPAQAQSTFWRALGPSLDEPVTKAAETALEAFATAHEIPRDKLARPIRALRFLVRESVRRGLDTPAFTSFIDGITKGNETIRSIAVAGYERARVHLVSGYASRAVRAHGSVLSSVEWRLDRLVATAEATDVDADVALLCLELDRPDGTKKTVRMQADLGRIRALRAACDAIEATARRRK